MATEATQDYSKQQRIINALAVYPDRYEFNAAVVAELTDASDSYVYRLQGEVDDTDIEESEFADDLTDDLQEAYRDEIEALLDDYDAERHIDDDDGNEDGPEREWEEGELEDSIEDGKEAVNETPRGDENATPGGQIAEQSEAGEETTEETPMEQLQEIREQLERHREEAEFGRKNFEGPAVDVAHGKYYVANDAIERLDHVIDDTNNS